MSVTKITETHYIALGTRMEEEGFSHAEIDAYFLEHHGVKGQRWGVRRGRSSTGVSRTGGHIIELNNRNAEIIKSARSGEKYKASAALGRAFVGRDKQKQNWSKSLRLIREQNARIVSGKTTRADKLDMFMRTGVMDLVITDRKHA